MAEDFYRAVLENVPWGAIVASTDLGGRCRYVNPEFTRLTGYTLDHVPTVRDWIEHAYPEPEYRAEVLAHWSTDTAAEHMSRDVVYRVCCLDGESKEIQFRASLIAPGQMIVTLLDVTAARQAAQALEESEARYRALVETSPMGIVLHGSEEIEFANQMAARIAGAEGPDDLIGHPVFEFVDPASRPRAVELLAQLEQGGNVTVPAEQRFVRLDGSLVDVAVTGAAVQRQGRRAYQVVFSDISERKRLEREQRALADRLQRTQQSESLALLAGGVAHDLNNLLTGILGHAELAGRAVVSATDMTEHLTSIVEAAKRAADLTGQMLAYAGRRRIVFEPIDLNAIVRQTERLLVTTLGDRGALSIELAHELPALQGDATQLRQILLNLVANAGDALGGRGGSVRLATGVVSVGAPCLRDAFAPERPSVVPHVWLEVSDDGAGMDEATQRRIFDPFFTTKARGRGLGLAAVEGIVRAHGGAIRVTTALGRGASFRAYFPASDQAAAQPSARNDRDDEWKGSGTILVVDDEPLVRQVAAAMLGQAGFTTLEARDGTEAVAMVRSQSGNVDAVLLDLTMPGASGEKTLQALRAERADLPVVLTSGFDQTDCARRLDALAPAGFLQKPYTYRQLARVFRAALGG